MPKYRLIRILALALAGATASPAAAEPADADPAFAPRREARELSHFEIGERDVALFARGRSAIDTQESADAIEDAQCMDKVFPGYPQPALMTVGVRVSL
jgi:hypothetical protein